jgi:hypothetical protein
MIVKAVRSIIRIRTEVIYASVHNIHLAELHKNPFFNLEKKMKKKTFDLQCKILDRVDEIRSDFTIVPEYASKEMPSRMDLAISLDYAKLTDEELENLLSFRNGDFGHDIFGINKYMSRSTHQLENFTPRCSI